MTEPLPNVTLVRYFPSRACTDGAEFVGLYTTPALAYEAAERFANKNVIEGRENMEQCIAQNFEMEEFVIDKDVEPL